MNRREGGLCIERERETIFNTYTKSALHWRMYVIGQLCRQRIALHLGRATINADFLIGAERVKKMLLAALNEPCVLAEKTLICCSWHRFCPLVAVHERCVVIACNVTLFSEQEGALQAPSYV